MEFVITVAIVTLASIAIFQLNGLVSSINARVSNDAYLNQLVKYQVALLLLSIIVLLLAYLQAPQNFKLFFSLGELSAPADPVEWFGIEKNSTWLFVGPVLCMVITLGTASFVTVQFRKLKIYPRQVLPYLVWIIVFSLTNSFSEEAIFRIGLISPLYGEIGASKLILLSAIVFGLVHFSGMPYGLIGMLMAGFLGWFLAKSVMETQGLFWAWLIHFIQDVVIYIGFTVANLSAKRPINVAAHSN